MICEFSVPILYVVYGVGREHFDTSRIAKQCKQHVPCHITIILPTSGPVHLFKHWNE